MIPNIALVPLELDAFKVGEAMPPVVGVGLLIGGLIALRRIRRDSGALHTIGVQTPKSRAKDVAVACIAIGAVAVLAGLSNYVKSISFEPERRIVIAETAGGVPRVQLAPQITGALEQRRDAAAKEGIDFQYGGYAHPTGGDVPVLFIGGDHKSSRPTRTITELFAGIAKSSGGQRPELTEYSAGELGGEVRCAAVTQLHCVWADRSTYGAVTATDISEPELAALLVKMRTDLEQKQ